MFAPRISKVLKNDIDDLKAGDDVMILLTDMFYFIRVLHYLMKRLEY